MTNEQITALVNFQKLFNPYGVTPGLRLQGNADARIAFLEKNVPVERKMWEFYKVGELSLRSIVKSVAECDWNDLVEMQNKFDAIMANYRSREQSLVDDEYGVYVRELEKHNRDAKYDRRKKVKAIMTRDEFAATLPGV